MNKIFKLANSIYIIERRIFMKDILNNLNIFLSNLNDFYRKLQNFRWNIKGRNFFTVHSKLEEFYNELNEKIDEIAEHILSLEGQPLGTLKDYLETASITEAKNDKVDSSYIFKELIKDYSTLLQDVKNIKKMADNNSETKTSVLMDEFIEDYTKKIWMLKYSIDN